MDNRKRPKLYYKTEEKKMFKLKKAIDESLREDMDYMFFTKKTLIEDSKKK